jgi:hypothetical protein
VKYALLFALVLISACRDGRPPSPTAEQGSQLNEADAMLNAMANEEKPEDRSPGPSNSSD